MPDHLSLSMWAVPCTHKASLNKKHNKKQTKQGGERVDLFRDEATPVVYSPFMPSLPTIV